MDLYKSFCNVLFFLVIASIAMCPHCNTIPVQSESYAATSKPGLDTFYIPLSYTSCFSVYQITSFEVFQSS